VQTEYNSSMQYVADTHQYTRYGFTGGFYRECMSIFVRGRSAVCIRHVDPSLSGSSEGILYILWKSIF